MGPAGAELRHRTALRRPDDAVRLGGDQALVVEAEKHKGLDKLGLDGWCTHSQDGLTWEDGSPLRNSPNITSEGKAAQIFQKALGKTALRPQVGDVLLIKVQIFDILHYLGQACRDGKAALVRDGAVKHIEIAHPVGQTGLEIAVPHGQLVKIAEHGQICLCFHL